MIIMGVDPSLTNVGVVVYNTENNNIAFSKTLKFVKKDKDQFLSKIKENAVDQAKMWTAHRLHFTYDFLKDIIEKFNVETVVTESQINRDVVKSQAIINMASSCSYLNLIEYKPTEWKKIATGKGNIKENELLNFIYNTFEQHHLLKYCSEHEIDCFGLIFAFMKSNGIKSNYLRYL